MSIQLAIILLLFSALCIYCRDIYYQHDGYFIKVSGEFMMDAQPTRAINSQLGYNSLDIWGPLIDNSGEYMYFVSTADRPTYKLQRKRLTSNTIETLYSCDASVTCELGQYSQPEGGMGWGVNDTLIIFNERKMYTFEIGVDTQPVYVTQISTSNGAARGRVYYVPLLNEYVFATQYGIRAMSLDNVNVVRSVVTSNAIGGIDIAQKTRTMYYTIRNGNGKGLYKLSLTQPSAESILLESMIDTDYYFGVTVNEDMDQLYFLSATIYSEYNSVLVRRSTSLSMKNRIAIYDFFTGSKSNDRRDNGMGWIQLGSPFSWTEPVVASPNRKVQEIPGVYFFRQDVDYFKIMRANLELNEHQTLLELQPTLTMTGGPAMDTQNGYMYYIHNDGIHRIDYQQANPETEELFNCRGQGACRIFQDYWGFGPSIGFDPINNVLYFMKKENTLGKYNAVVSYLALYYFKPGETYIPSLVHIFDGTDASGITIVDYQGAQIYSDANGDLWFTNFDEGVYKLENPLDPETRSLSKIISRVKGGSNDLSYGVAIDTKRNVLYYTEGDTVYSFNMQGSNRKTLFTTVDRPVQPFPTIFSNYAILYDPVSDYVFLTYRSGIGYNYVLRYNPQTEEVATRYYLYTGIASNSFAKMATIIGGNFNDNATPPPKPDYSDENGGGGKEGSSIRQGACAFLLLVISLLLSL